MIGYRRVINFLSRIHLFSFSIFVFFYLVSFLTYYMNGDPQILTIVTKSLYVFQLLIYILAAIILLIILYALIRIRIFYAANILPSLFRCIIVYVFATIFYFWETLINQGWSL